MIPGPIGDISQGNIGQANGDSLTQVKIDNGDSPYSASAGELIFCDVSTGNIIVELPDAATVTGERLGVIKDGTQANIVTTNGFGSQLVAGKNTLKISGDFNSIILESDGLNWYAI